jgi:hypothetical protein
MGLLYMIFKCKLLPHSNSSKAVRVWRAGLSLPLTKNKNVRIRIRMSGVLIVSVKENVKEI